MRSCGSPKQARTCVGERGDGGGGGAKPGGCVGGAALAPGVYGGGSSGGGGGGNRGLGGGCGGVGGEGAMTQPPATPPFRMYATWLGASSMPSSWNVVSSAASSSEVYARRTQ